MENGPPEIVPTVADQESPGQGTCSLSTKHEGETATFVLVSESIEEGESEQP